MSVPLRDIVICEQQFVDSTAPTEISQKSDIHPLLAALAFSFTENLCTAKTFKILGYLTSQENLHITDAMLAVKSALEQRPAVVTARVCFLQDRVRIVVAQSYSQQREEYNAARSQCWLRMLAFPPNNFDVKLTGSVSCPGIEVSVHKALIGKLPLLSEVGSSTDAQTELQSDKEIIPCDDKENGRPGDFGTQTAELRLPCSVWGVVSLLLVLDKNISIEPWFDDAASDPRLPEETLQAAEFLGCDEIRSCIIQWLRAALSDVSQHCANTASGAAAAASLSQSCPRIWHLTEVLQYLDDNSAHEVFSTPSGESTAAAAEIAINLPQNLLEKWIRSRSPAIDLSSAKLSHIQWTRVALALSHPGCNKLTSLDFPVVNHPQPVLHSEEFQRFRHLLQFWTCQRPAPAACCCCGKDTSAVCSKVSVGFQCQSNACRQFCATTYAPVYEIKSILAMHSSPRAVQTCSNFYQQLKEFCDTAPDTPSFCCSCKASFWGKPSLLLVGFLCSSCGKMCPVRTTRPPQVPVLSIMASGWCTKVSNDVTQVLCALSSAASNLRHLQHLGLHHLPFALELVPILGQLLRSLRHSLTSLTLSEAYIVENSNFGAPEKALLLGALTRAQKLRKVSILNWELVIGTDAQACVGALQNLPELEAIVVSKVTDCSTFPACLPFRAESEEQ